MKSEQQAQLTEFPEGIPRPEDAQQIASNFCWNRSFLLENAEQMGLNTEFLLEQESTVLVGPFVGPGPIPTTFGGDPANVAVCNATGSLISEALQKNGYTVQQAQLVTLDSTEMPRRGPEMMDCLVVPKNQQSNQKVRVVKPPQWRTPYNAVEITSEDVAAMQDQINKMYGEYARRTKQRKNSELVDSILEDIQGLEENELYVNFAQAFNKKIMARTAGTSLPYVPVDVNYYQPFLQQGISEIGRFVEVLDSVGFFDENPGFVKAVNENNQVETYAFEEIISENDIMLRSKDNDSDITYQELMNSGLLVAPCKELSYLFTLGQMVPVVYGSENRGNYYRPYAVAKQQLEQLGLKPTLYRTQPRSVEDINSFDTIYDYYQNIL